MLKYPGVEYPRFVAEFPMENMFNFSSTIFFICSKGDRMDAEVEVEAGAKVEKLDVGVKAWRFG